MSPAATSRGVFHTMCEDPQPDREPKSARLRTFRSSSDQPYLVLPGTPSARAPADVARALDDDIDRSPGDTVTP
ncbi:MAG: hypothetical protein R8G01_21190 [Ilumatobacteraceae bacterium]|nr:hypothetical protein [Ilumatobacteraceae bacterium]